MSDDTDKCTFRDDGTVELCMNHMSAKDTSDESQCEYVRALTAESAIDRVVRLAANWQRRFDSSIRHPADIASIPIEEVFAALDGGSDD